MNRIRWYGPSLVLLATVLVVMIWGPNLIRRLEAAQTDVTVSEKKAELAKNTTLKQLNDAFRSVGAVVEPSVVHIQVFRKAGDVGSGPNDLLRRFFGPDGPTLPDDQTPSDPTPRRRPRTPTPPNSDQFDMPQAYATGSGWVYDDHGRIITNYHVVRSADKITVKFVDGQERTAKVLGSDPKTDIAVLEVGGDGFHKATLATEPVQQGDIVFAFGSPLQFEFSMSQGIVSGKGRHLGILREEQGYEDFIQTDAAINPGNSGGPLCDIHGDVVGMNTAIATHTGENNGLGFAIPVDMIQGVAQQIIKNGKVSRGYLGIMIRDLDPKMAASFSFTGKGVLVESLIKGGPAAEAGVKRGDIITRIDDKATPTSDELRGYVATLPAGKEIKIEVFRDGKTVTLTATIQEMPEQTANLGRPGPEAEPAPADKTHKTLDELGLTTVSTFTQATAKQMGVTFEPGVLVKEVRPNSAAASVNIRRGSVIVDVQGVKVASVEDLTTELAKYDLKKKGVRVSVSNGGTTSFEVLALPGE